MEMVVSGCTFFLSYFVFDGDDCGDGGAGNAKQLIAT